MLILHFEFKQKYSTTHAVICLIDNINEIDKSNYACKIFVDLKKNLWPLFMDGVQLTQGYSHFEEAVYFLPFKGF